VRTDRSEVDNHTNIAWELFDHVLFDPEFGTLTDLVAELEASPCDRALLSSEEFACLFNRPEDLGRLKTSLEGAGYAPHVVLTLRDVDEYAESLYVTLASYAFPMTYEEFTEKVATDREVTFRQNTYCFDYQRLVGAFADVFGDESVTCVDFDREDAVGPFLEATDWFFAGALTGVDTGVRSNSTMSRIEELRNRVQVRQDRIDHLELEIDGLEAQIRGLNVTLDWFRTALEASEQRFGRRVGRRIRSVVWPRSRSVPPGDHGSGRNP
jgi:hypothetical protein